MRLQVSVKTPNGVETASLEAGRRYELTMSYPPTGGSSRDQTVTGVFEQATWSPHDGRVWIFIRSELAGLIGYDQRNIVDVRQIGVYDACGCEMMPNGVTILRRCHQHQAYLPQQSLEPIERVEAYRG